MLEGGRVVVDECGAVKKQCDTAFKRSKIACPLNRVSRADHSKPVMKAMSAVNVNNP